MITYGSLCTGYDGLGMGLALAGLDVVPLWVAENDPAMARVLKREHDDIPNVGDIKTAPWCMAPPVQIMSSGDPCQSISIAGRQAGRDDPRFLWPWVRAAYREVRPGALFFENVANIVSHDKGYTLHERHEHLRADGYEVRWGVIGACAVGAPHHRHRYYAVAAYVGAGAPEARRVDSGKAICGAPRSGGRVLLPSPAARDGADRNEGSPEFWANRWATRPDRVGKGIPLGAAVNLLPSPTASDHFGAGRAPEKQGGDNLRTVIATLLPTPKATDGSNGGPNQRDGAGNYYLPGVANLLPTPTATNANGGNKVNNHGELLLPGIAVRPEVWGKYAEAVALWEAITGVPAPAPTEPGKKGAPRLSPRLPEWMMGLRPGLLTGELSRPEALKGAGNGVVPLAAAAAWRLLTA